MAMTDAIPTLAVGLFAVEPGGQIPRPCFSCASLGRVGCCCYWRTLVRLGLAVARVVESLGAGVAGEDYTCSQEGRGNVAGKPRWEEWKTVRGNHSDCDESTGVLNRYPAAAGAAVCLHLHPPACPPPRPPLPRYPAAAPLSARAPGSPASLSATCSASGAPLLLTPRRSACTPARRDASAPSPATLRSQGRGDAARAG
jgi:hypothetical protein